jgi:hypothetical protein
LIFIKNLQYATIPPSDEERRRIQLLEPFDEHAALHCFHRSYGLVVASSSSSSSSSTRAYYGGGDNVSFVAQMLARCSDMKEHSFNLISSSSCMKAVDNVVSLSSSSSSTTTTSTTSSSSSLTHQMSGDRITIEALDDSTDDHVISAAMELITNANQLLCEDYPAVRRFWKNVRTYILSTCVCVCLMFECLDTRLALRYYYFYSRSLSQTVSLSLSLEKKKKNN